MGRTAFLGEVDGAMGGVAAGVEEGGELGEELQSVSSENLRRIRACGAYLVNTQGLRSHLEEFDQLCN